MEYISHKFENTAEGLRKKDAYTLELAPQGYRIASEHVEKGHILGGEQGCSALLFLPLILLAGRPPETILVTYQKETIYCPSCGASVVPEHSVCPGCNANLPRAGVADEDLLRLIAEQKQRATERTADINEKILQLSRVLKDTLAHDHRFDWELLRTPFGVPQPLPQPLQHDPPKPALLQLAYEIPIIEKLMPALREKRLAWEKTRDENREQNALVSAQYERASKNWKKVRDLAEQQQTAQIEAKKKLYLAKDPAALLDYWGKVLERSQYPDDFPREHRFDYLSDEGQLTVESVLPSIDVLPSIGEIQYNQAQNTLEEIPVLARWRNETYSELLINVALRTIYELFQSDSADALKSITFNGSIRMVDRSTGQKANSIVLSVEANKAEFMAIDLAQIDSQACFNRLRGVLSEDPSQGVAVAPHQRRA